MHTIIGRWSDKSTVMIPEEIFSYPWHFTYKLSIKVALVCVILVGRVIEGTIPELMNRFKRFETLVLVLTFI